MGAMEIIDIGGRAHRLHKGDVPPGALADAIEDDKYVLPGPEPLPRPDLPQRRAPVAGAFQQSSAVIM
jgi:hypothetical protein